MPAYIRKRTVGANRDERRYDVVYRRGGRGFKLEHAGTFRTVREANIRHALVSEWLAGGRNPRRELELLVKPAERVSLSTVAAQWLTTRVDLDASTVDVYRGMQTRIGKRFGDWPVDTIAPEDVSEWVGEMIGEGLKPGTVANYVRLLRMQLDVLDDNPARHKSVRLPRRDAKVVEPPDADEVVALLENMSARFRPAVVLMEQTGMRVTEAVSVRAADIDRAGMRVRVRPETSKGARPRWVPIAAWYADVVEPVRGDRHAVGSAMARAGGVHPHALRHRRASLWHQQGVVAVELAARLGHRRASMSLDVYSHVRPLKEANPDLLLAALGYG